MTAEPQRGVVIVNPESGHDEVNPAELGARFAGGRVVEVGESDLAELASAALAEKPDAVAVAGGDGTIRVVAALAATAGVPLVPVPVGTRNHFARQLGIDTVEQAAAAWLGGATRAVDLAEVNGERFINNSSIGFYAGLVREREVHERRMPEIVAQLAAAWVQARRGHRFGVRIDGQPFRAWLVFVGNGCYGDGLNDLAERETLDGNVLDVRVLRADQPLARTRAVLNLLAGRTGRSALIERTTATEVVIALDDRRQVDVAVDGDVMTLDNPLRYRSLPGVLTVKVVPGGS